jgi:hypothetical protein
MAENLMAEFAFRRFNEDNVAVFDVQDLKITLLFLMYKISMSVLPELEDVTKRPAGVGVYLTTDCFNISEETMGAEC